MHVLIYLLNDTLPSFGKAESGAIKPSSHHLGLRGGGRVGSRLLWVFNSPTHFQNHLANPGITCPHLGHNIPGRRLVY